MLTAAIATHLDSLGIVTYDPDNAGGDCFLEFVPSEPDEVVVITGTGGFSQGSKLPHDMPTFQVRTRGPRHDPRSSVAKQQEIYNVLTCLDGLTIDPGGPDETYVIGFTPMQAAGRNPVSIGQDDNQRPEHVLNYRADTTNTTTRRALTS